MILNTDKQMHADFKCFRQGRTHTYIHIAFVSRYHHSTNKKLHIIRN